MTQASHNSHSLFGMVVALQWLGLPTIAVMFATVWQQLPERIAIHFGLANQANGWMTREETLVIFLALATFCALTSTWICSRISDPDPLAWSLIGLFYVILGTLIYVERSVLAFNIYGEPVNVVPALMAGMLSALLAVVLAISTKRGGQLPASRVLAEERHGGSTWAALLSAGIVLVAFVIRQTPIPGLQIALAMALLLMMIATAMAWGGFRYIFTSSGLEIRTLGFRVRSVPAEDIRSYTVDHWNWLGGYGIRGLGNQRAYVWGNHGVRIRTATGQVFLGHPEPQRIIRDLDKVMQNRKPPSDL